MKRLAELVYLMLPVYAANMAAPFARYWPWRNPPISERRLGSHKTTVGFALGVAAAVLTAFVQSTIGWEGSIAAYDRWLLLGLACGVGALGGDALKSFVKRRVGIVPGARWIPADQLDFVVGGLIALAPFVRLSPVDVVTILVLSFVGDILVNQASFRLGIRRSAW